MFLTDTLAKMPQNIFAYYSVSEYSASFSLFEKKIFWLRPGDSPPPPFMERSVFNMFFYAFSKVLYPQHINVWYNYCILWHWPLKHHDETNNFNDRDHQDDVRTQLRPPLLHTTKVMTTKTYNETSTLTSRTMTTKRKAKTTTTTTI